ncbi:hypothetical protein D9M71_743350 [compost metagenome]
MAEGQQPAGFGEGACLVEVVLFVPQQQPGADVVGQGDHGLLVQQPPGAGLVQGGGQFHAQQVGVAVVAGVERRADRQQVAAGPGGADIAGQTGAQVGQVVGAGALAGPYPVSGQAAHQEGGDQGHQQFAHGIPEGRRCRSG